VTDGKDTCEGDPCELVRKLKKIGVNFVMHVIGFDVSKKDKAQLECIAQAGDGSYYPAQNAGDFLSALKKATQPKPKVKVAQEALYVGAVKDGRRLTVKITILKGERIVIDDDNSIKNPRDFYLEPGLYTIRATDTSSQVTLSHTATAEFKGEKMVKIFDFSDGRLSVRAIKDGLPVTAYFHIKRAGTEERLAAGDTSEFNPQTIKLLPGIYDMEATDPEQPGRAPIFLSGIHIEGGKLIEKTIDFSEAELRISLLVNGAPGTGEITVFKAGTDEQVLSRDTSSANPVLMKLVPGHYDIIAEIIIEDKNKTIEKKDIAVTLTQRVSLEFSF